MTTSKGQRATKPKPVKAEANDVLRFEAAKLQNLYPILDAIAWMDAPSIAQAAQFSDVDARTAGKLMKNACQIGLVHKSESGFILQAAYPYRGTEDQKRDVVREAMAKMPLLKGVRQFLSLGDSLDTALRKSATLNGYLPFVAGDFAPLISWAKSLEALEPSLDIEDIVDGAQTAKAERHRYDSKSRVAFLSHSSADKPFVRKLATDLSQQGIKVWLDEQQIRVGESIPERIGQGLAESDFFLIALSKNSVESEWVKKELSGALVNEVQRRSVHIMPLRLDDAPIPIAIREKKYADFSISYKSGFQTLISSIKAETND